MRVAQEPQRLNDAAGEPPSARRDNVMRTFLSQQVMLSSFLFSLTEDWDITEEALQETAIFICNRWQDFTPGTNAGSWLRTIARLRCREVLQRRKRNAAAPLETVDAAALVSESEWSAPAFSARHTAALAQCVKGLPEAHQQIVELHYTRRERCERIAALLQKSVDAVYMTLSRIRKRLRECVERRLQREAP
jgi:RNA polymerase sigma-70 factor (ECF subfamily)